jgi:hypothetical protein
VGPPLGATDDDPGAGRDSWVSKRPARINATGGRGVPRETRALQAYLGHKNIQHTVRYTELSPDRFQDFWR